MTDVAPSDSFLNQLRRKERCRMKTLKISRPRVARVCVKGMQGFNVQGSEKFRLAILFSSWRRSNQVHFPVRKREAPFRLGKTLIWDCLAQTLFESVANPSLASHVPCRRHISSIVARIWTTKQSNTSFQLLRHLVQQNGCNLTMTPVLGSHPQDPSVLQSFIVHSTRHWQTRHRRQLQ